MSKIATIPVFSSIVAILFFLNCQRWGSDIVSLNSEIPLFIRIADTVPTIKPKNTFKRIIYIIDFERPSLEYLNIDFIS